MVEVSGDVAFQAMGRDLPPNVMWPYEIEPWKSRASSRALYEDSVAAGGRKSPTGHLFRGYHALQGLLEGIRKAGSTEVPAVIAALEGLSWDSVIGPYTIRPQDHAGVGNLFVGTYATQPEEPYVRLKEMVTVPELSVIETPLPGKEYVV